MDRSVDAVRAAAIFFIEQVLLSPEADSYRVLGAGPEATSSELRRNMSQLLKRFHPDADRSGYRSGFAARVTLAWQDLKTPARRAAYDASRQALRPNGARRRDNAGGSVPAKDASKPGGRTSGRASRGTRKRHVGIYRIEQPSPLQRALLFLFGRLGR
jgi:DnaJ-class molecular chaperone